MYLTCYILYSKSNNYLINKYYKLKLLEKIGEGKYGLIYEINKNYVIKIFKNSLITTNINEESESVIPLNNENREISFFISYLKNKTTNTNFIIDVKSIGILVDDYTINNLIIKKNSFFMILPSCISIYKLLNLWKTPLINNKDGIEIVLNIMKRLIDIQLFLYNNYNIINLDIKTDNLMIEKKNKLIIDNIIICHGGINPHFVDKYNKINNLENEIEFVESYNKMLREKLLNSEPVTLGALVILLYSPNIILILTS